MFKELLAIYKSADDKTNLFKDQIPEDKYEAVMSALETEDEAKFNDLMNAEPVSNEPVEDTPVENPQEGAPAVEDTGSLVEDSTLEEGPIVEQPEIVTEDQQKVILPTLNAVIEMTNNVQGASDEEIAELPEDIREGVEIWKDADEDFSVKIIAETVNKFHNGDFSEIETPSDKDILITGAEIAKELKDKGEHKTSLNRATEDIQAELEDARLSDLLRIHGELCAMEAKAEDLVEDVIEKNDLAVSPSKKEELIIKVIDDNIYEDSNKDDFKKGVAESLNQSGDYSSRDMSERLNIFNDFSELELKLDEEISPDTAELLESVDCFKEAKDLVEDAIADEMAENPCAFDKPFEASINAQSFIDSAKGHARSVYNLFKDYLSDKKNLAKVGGAAAGAVLAIPAAKAISETEEGDSTGDKIVKKTLGVAIPVAAAVGGKALADNILKSKDHSEEAPAEEQISQEVIDNALSNDDQIRALVEKYKMLPTVEAKDQMKADMQTLGFTDEVINMIEQYAEGNFSEGEEAPAEEVKAEEVVEEAPAEETADVASMVAPELFDSLLGPGVGEADPVDGTLPVGEVEAPGTDIGHLGTLDEGIPAGEPVPEDDKEVTKVEIVSPEGDEFESIMR